MRATIRILLFLAPIAAVAGLVEYSARPLWPEATGPGVQERIERSFAAAVTRKYDVLLLGNSRIYRGINPDQLGVAAYNFAQDDDAFNQVYYKLQYLDARGVRFHTLVLGVDYFEFSFLSDRRNGAYAQFLGEEYLRDFANDAGSGPNRLMQSVLHPIDEQEFNNTMIRRFTRPAALLMERAVAIAQRTPPPPPIRVTLRDNGQYIVDAGPQRVDPIRRDATRLPIQEQYFRRTLQWAAGKHIKVLLVMPPLRRMELDSYPAGVVSAFDQWLQQIAAQYGAVYLNFARHPEFSDADFADVTHLNESAADRFSRLVGAAIQ